MTVKMIMATGLNYEIGKDNKLLWHLPQDLDYFKDQTQYFNVVMGNNTFKSLPFKDGLPNRTNWIVTRDFNYRYYIEPDTKLKFISAPAMQFILNSNLGDKETFWIIGGSQIYDEFIDFVDEIHWTLVYKSYLEADVFLTDKTIKAIETDFEIIDKVRTKVYDEKSDVFYSTYIMSRLK